MHSTTQDRMSILYFLRTAHDAVLDPSLVDEEYLGICEFECGREPIAITTLIKSINTMIPHELCVV